MRLASPEAARRLGIGMVFQHFSLCESHDTWGGIKDGMVVLAPFSNMPADVRAMADETVKAIAAGTLKPFVGPITKQDGSTAVKDGESTFDPMILGMNWYVKGIDDTLPQ